jgi:hypothetical protein
MPSKEYWNKRYRERRAWMLNFLGGKCVRCGTTSKRLYIDHIDPETKEFTLANFYNLSLANLKVELKKCQLLCGSCHAKKSYREDGANHCVGESVAGAKLTKKEVEEIRVLYETGNFTQSQLGYQYGVSRSNIGHIVNHRNWTHI